MPAAHRLLLVWTVVVCGATAACQGQDRRHPPARTSERSRPHSGQAQGPHLDLLREFNLTLRRGDGVEVHACSPVEDFALFDFWYDGQLLLETYTGNHPSFPVLNHPRNAVRDLESTEANVQECCPWTESDGTRSRECRLYIAPDGTTAQYAHCWYDGLAPKLQPKADAIIASIERRR